MGFSATQNFADEVALVSALSAAWLAFYLVIRHAFCSKYSADFSNRIVSLVHAALGLVWPWFVLDMTRLQENVGSATTPQQLTLLRVSFAYFFYDMLCCMAIKLEPAEMFHHIATLLGLYVGVFERVSGHELLLCLTLMEASNPFLHMRNVFRELGQGGTRLADLNDVAFAVTFLICRNFLGLFVVYWTLTCPQSPCLVKAGGLGILLISLFWTTKLVSLIQRKLFKKPQKKAL